MAQFKPGQSGNPNGKPPGTKSRYTRLRAQLEPYSEELVKKAADMALQGDSGMMRLCLERLIPAYKAEGAVLFLPSMKDAENATDQAKETLTAMADGELSVTDGAALLTAIAQQSRIKEIDQFEQRLIALENARAK